MRGFVQLQDLVDRAIIETHVDALGAAMTPSPLEVTTLQMPFPCHQEDE